VSKLLNLYHCTTCRLCTYNMSNTRFCFVTDPNPPPIAPVSDLLLFFRSTTKYKSVAWAFYNDTHIQPPTMDFPSVEHIV